MTEFDPLLRFVLAGLAVWRVTHMFVHEDGPGDVFVRLRRALGSTFLGRLIDCFYCLSLWVALPFALLAAQKWTGRLLGWLALSGASCLLERIGAQPVSITPISEEEHHELLRR
jgi:hypothetical protein